MIYDRHSRQLIDEVSYGSRALDVLYTTVFGRVLLQAIVSRPASYLSGLYYQSKLSTRKVSQLINHYDIDTSEFASNTFSSFNEFFVRTLKPSARPIVHAAHALIAPADAKLRCFTISEDLRLHIKHADYGVRDIVGRDADITTFSGGTCLIFRLTIDDCHRYVFPDSGRTSWSYRIRGLLHTVQPIAHTRFKPYSQNHRVVSMLATDHFDDIIMVEVGALLVGVIHNHEKKTFKKGEEKGYFELGGSTIVIFLKPGAVRIDEDIIRHSTNGIETKVRQGEAIGIHV